MDREELSGRRAELRRYDDWTVYVDDALQHLAGRIGELVATQREILKVLRELNFLDADERKALHDFVETLTARDVLDRRRSRSGRRWQDRWGPVLAVAAVAVSLLAATAAWVAIVAHR